MFNYSNKLVVHSKTLISILFFNIFFLISGKSQHDFSLLDQHVLATPAEAEKKLDSLCRYLIGPAKNDLEKTRCIYQWIIRNITYDHKAFKKGNKRVNRNIDDILKRKKAICWGYASLFKAMCAEVDLPCEIISGYGRTSLIEKVDLERPNHAWNSVKIDSSWFLLDATWDSGVQGKESDFKNQFGYSYFLTPPPYFIVNHLPADPDWQLLECPISPWEYQLSLPEILKRAKKTDCHQSTDLDALSYMGVHEKRLKTAFKTFDYNPTEANRREWAHAQLDYEAYLGEIAEKLQVEKKIDSLLLIQSEMILLCEMAEKLTPLYENQRENCAYNYFNHAVSLATKPSGDEDIANSLQKWEKVFDYLKIAQGRIEALPQNIFTGNALSLCRDYLDYAKRNIERLQR